MKVDGISSSQDVMNQYAINKNQIDGSAATGLEDATKNAKAAKDDAKLKSVCKDFEAMFLNFMYSKMRETVPEDGLFEKSNGEKIMQSMMDTEMTKNMAAAGGIGLGKMMYQQLALTAYNKTTK